MRPASPGQSSTRATTVQSSRCTTMTVGVPWNTMTSAGSPCHVATAVSTSGPAVVSVVVSVAAQSAGPRGARSPASGAESFVVPSAARLAYALRARQDRVDRRAQLLVGVDDAEVDDRELLEGWRRRRRRAGLGLVGRRRRHVGRGRRVGLAATSQREHQHGNADDECGDGGHDAKAAPPPRAAGVADGSDHVRTRRGGHRGRDRRLPVVVAHGLDDLQVGAGPLEQLQPVTQPRVGLHGASLLVVGFAVEDPGDEVVLLWGELGSVEGRLGSVEGRLGSVDRAARERRRAARERRRAARERRRAARERRRESGRRSWRFRSDVDVAGGVPQAPRQLGPTPGDA